MFKKTAHKKIIKSCIRGDRKAQYELYEMNKVYLFGVCMRYSKTKEEAEDILQDAFYKIFKDLKQFNGEVPIQAWMRKVTINTALMHIRKNKNLKYVELDEFKYEQTAHIDNAFLTENRASDIIHIIRKLPDVQQMVFNLRAMDEYPFKEISEMMGGNEATLRSHYLRARKSLQSMLKKELY